MNGKERERDLGEKTEFDEGYRAEGLMQGCRKSVGDGKPGTGRKEEEDRSEKTE